MTTFLSITVTDEVEHDLPAKAEGAFRFMIYDLGTRYMSPAEREGVLPEPKKTYNTYRTLEAAKKAAEFTFGSNWSRWAEIRYETSWYTPQCA